MTGYGMPSLWVRVWQSLVVLWRVFVTRPVRRVPRGAVVVVLDAIEPYASLWSERKTRALSATLARARDAGHTVLFTRWARVRGDPDDVIDRKGHWSLVLPSKDARLLEGLRAPSDRVVDVVHTNALKSEAVRECVGSSPVVLCGMWTESCVVNTARALADDNIRVTVVSSCCGGHVPVCWIGLWSIAQLYADVAHAVTFSGAGKVQ